MANRNRYEFVKYDGKYLEYTVTVPPFDLTALSGEQHATKENKAFMEEYEDFRDVRKVKLGKLGPEERFYFKVRCDKKLNKPYIDKLEYFLNRE